VRRSQLSIQYCISDSRYYDLYLPAVSRQLVKRPELKSACPANKVRHRGLRGARLLGLYWGNAILAHAHAGATGDLARPADQPLGRPDSARCVIRI
jgi:hypothetical protein